jgi:thiamine transport system substrate-binding protein
MPAEGAMIPFPRVRAHGRSNLCLFFIFIFTFLGFGLGALDKKLVVYTYDSFVSEWGPAPVIEPLFEKASGIDVEFVAKGDGGQLLATLLLEKGESEADIALGLDNFLLEKALASGLFSPYKPKGYSSLPAELRIDPSARLIPYDYGYFAIMWDSAKLANPPKSLEDLTKKDYAKKLILLDPRTSTPGLGFLAWTKAVYGKAWKDYWKRLAPNVLVLAPGWDQGYGLFTSGEAPLVVSYASSAAYHLEYEKTERYKALSFSDGALRQIEVAGILAGAPHRSAAEAFMDFLLSVECQRELPLTQWMYPVHPDITLPESFRAAPRPASSLSVDSKGLTEDALSAVEILSSSRK